MEILSAILQMASSHGTLVFFSMNAILFTGQTLALLAILILCLHLHCTSLTYAIYTTTTYNTYNIIHNHPIDCTLMADSYTYTNSSANQIVAFT